MAKKVDIILSARDEASKVINNLAQGSLPALVRSLGGVVAAYASFQGVSSFVTGAFREAAEGEKVTRKLESALADAGLTVAAHSAHLEEMAAAYSKVSIYDDEAIKGAQTLLISLGGLAGEGLDRATQAAIKLAAGLDMDLTTAAMNVAKAANGTTTAMGKLGFVFTDGASAAKKFEEALDQIEKKFGSAATGQAETLSGRYQILVNTFKNFQEQAGAGMAEAVDAKEVLGYWTEFFESMEKAGTGPTIAALFGFTEDGRTMTFSENIRKALEIAQEKQAKALGLTREQLLELIEEEAARLRHQKEYQAALDAETEQLKEQKRLADERNKAEDERIKRLEGSAEGQRIMRKERGDLDFRAPSFLKKTGAKETIDALNKEVMARNVELAWNDVDDAIDKAVERARVFKMTSEEIVDVWVRGGGDAIRMMFEQYNIAVEDLGTELDRTFRGIGVDAALDFGDVLVDGAMRGKFEFKEFFRSLLSDLSKAIVRALILRAILGMTSGGGAGMGGETGFGWQAGGTTFANTGGWVGPNGFRRFSSGGPVGADTVPALLQPGEMVLTGAMVNSILGGKAALVGRGSTGRSVNVTLNVNAIDADSVRKHARSTARIYIDEIRRAERMGYLG